MHPETNARQPAPWKGIPEMPSRFVKENISKIAAWDRARSIFMTSGRLLTEMSTVSYGSYASTLFEELLQMKYAFELLDRCVFHII